MLFITITKGICALFYNNAITCRNSCMLFSALQKDSNV